MSRTSDKVFVRFPLVEIFSGFNETDINKDLASSKHVYMANRKTNRLNNHRYRPIRTNIYDKHVLLVVESSIIFYIVYSTKRTELI